MAAAFDYDVMAKHIVHASDTLNYPGTNKLYEYLKARSQHVPLNIVKAFVERQPERQIFTQNRRVRHPRQSGPIMQTRPNLSEGRVPALDLNDRWMADLADLTAQPSVNAQSEATPFQYILVVLNVFSKRLWAKALRVKSPAAVTAAFKEILNGQHPPSRLDTDLGSEFQGPFSKFLDEKKIWHVVKDPEAPNTLAPIDRAIATLKRAIFRRVVADEDNDWAASLQKTVDGYNETIHNALQGRTPDEVEDDPELQFALRRANSEAMVHNAEMIHARNEKLTTKGAFRVRDPNRPFARSYQPRYGDVVHEVKKIEGNFVTDEHGNSFKSRHTLAVPSGSANASHTENMRGGNALIERKQREALNPFKSRLEAFVGDGKWEFEVAAHMKTLDMAPLMKNGLNYRKSLLLLGFDVSDKGRVTKPGPQVVMAAAPAGPPRFRINFKRPELSPAQAAAALAAPAPAAAPPQTPGDEFLSVVSSGVAAPEKRKKLRLVRVPMAF